MTILSVVLEQVFLRDAAGRYGSLSTFNDSFWSRYLDVFEQVRVVARVQIVDLLPVGASILTDPRISVVEIPYYRGPMHYLRRLFSVRCALAQAATADGAWILRLPGVLSMDIAERLRASRRPYAVELVGDPHEIFQSGIAGSPITRPFLRNWFVRRTKSACAHASGVAYVSQHVLKRRYPAQTKAFTEHYSSIDLPLTQFASTPRLHRSAPNPVRLLSVGSLAYPVKGVDVLLRACAYLRDRNLPLRLEIVGEGILRTEYERLACDLELKESVSFLGHLPHDEIFRRMDNSDIFVLPSRSEGLPRVIVEAMARGTPCISTAVGGIPELLEAEWLAPAGDAAALASLITRASMSEQTLSTMSARNLRQARHYEAGVLAVRRARFYCAVRAMTEAS